MKKIILSFIICILFINSISIIVIPENIENIKKINEELIISKPIFKNNGIYLSLSIDEANSYLYEPGKPFLPVILKNYQFPLGTKIKKINIIYEGEEIYLLKKINPSPNLLTISEKFNGKQIYSEFDKTVYESQKFYPLEKFYLPWFSLFP